MISNYKTVKKEPIYYLCEITTNRPDLGETTESGEYPDGAQITVTARAKPGINFIGWERMGEIVSTDENYTLFIDRTTRLKAIFLKPYNITSVVSPSGFGEVIGAKIYMEGEQVTLQAKETVDGYSFIGWLINGETVSQNPIYSFIAEKDVEIEAKFGVICEVILNTDLGEAGMLNGSGKYAYGDLVTIYASPKAGLIFDGWEENGELISENESYSFYIQENRVFKALYHISELRYEYSGEVIPITLTPGHYKLEVWGAQGGYRTTASYGGMGGYSYGELTVTEPISAFIRVGGSGNTGGTSGGFNGGGKRSSYNGGGGASDIRLIKDDLYHRVIVAGGGGSDGASNKPGGYGGGTDGQSKSDNYGTGGYGGTQSGVTWNTSEQLESTTSSNGAYAGFGFGGNGISINNGHAGAGGGGWYGGSGSVPDSSGDDDRGGGGGSGFIWTGQTDIVTGFGLNDTHKLENAYTYNGSQLFLSPKGENETGHSGDGYVCITAISDKIYIPYQINSLHYTGEEQIPTWTGYDSNKMTITGELSAVEPGNYTVIFTPKDNYQWSDGTTEGKEVVWRINKGIIISIPTTSSSFTYDGNEKTPTWTGYDSNKMTITGELSGTNAGNYVAKFAPTENYQWSDGTTEGKEVVWSINRMNISSMPIAENNVFAYDSNEQIPTWTGYDPNKMEISGTTSAVEPGNYTVTFTPKENYQWSDGTTEGKVISWFICKASAEIPYTDNNIFDYNGTEQGPVWVNYDPDKMNAVGITGTNPGNYTAIFTLKKNYKWPGGTSEEKIISWSINGTIVEIPYTDNNIFDYNGTEQGPVWVNYDPDKMNAVGITGTNPGNYTAIFTLKDSYYVWSDNTSEEKVISWSINRATIILPTMSSSFTYDGNEKTTTWTGYDPNKMEISGTTSAVEPGNYTVTFTPKDNYQWSDGTTEGKEVVWRINKLNVALPSVSGTLTYDGNEKTPTWSGYDTNKMTISGELSGTNAGDYTVTFTPKENYQWSDGTTEGKEVVWNINRANVSLPSALGTLTYDGNEKTPTWNSYYDTNKLIIGGIINGTNAGDYTVTFTPKENYQWSDKTIVAKNVTWKINRASMPVPTTSSSFTYDGNEKVPVWNNYDPEKMEISGTTSGTVAGTYIATFTIIDTNYQWSDKTIVAKNVTWKIDRIVIPIPTTSSSFTYDGNEKVPVWNNYDPEKMEISGTTSGTVAGSYTAKFTPTDNYQWPDKTTGIKNVIWKIDRATIAYPSTTDIFVYDGNEKTPAWRGYNPEKMIISGTTVSTNAGSYTAKFTPTSNYKWTNGSTSYISITWKIDRAVIEIPSTNNNTFVYNGTVQGPTWINYDSTKMTTSYLTSTNAGNYTAKFTPTSNYKWTDGTTTTKSIAWSITKAAGYSYIDTPNNIALTNSDRSKVINITRGGTGRITVSSSDTSIATVTLSGTSITIKSVASMDLTSRNVTITIKVAGDTNYNAPEDIIINVSATVTPELNDLTWAQISEISESGQAANYFEIGDAKAVKLYGTIGTLSINATYYIYIIGFDHNSSREGTGISFEGFKTAKENGKVICLADSKYGNSISTGLYFNMNHNAVIGNTNKTGNAGGWKSCDLRYDILGGTDIKGGNASSSTATNPVSKTLMSVLPSDLRSVMKPMTKYTDNTGGSTQSGVNSSIEYITLASEFEIFGKREYANTSEQYYQKQYDYYKRYSAVKYRHNSQTIGISYHFRSPYFNNTNYNGDSFCCYVFNNGGTTGSELANTSRGISPILKI